MSYLLLYQTLVVARDFHRQILLRLDQELHPRFALLQEGLLLQQEGLQFASGSKHNTHCSHTLDTHQTSVVLYMWSYFQKWI